ncbi:hypothetical protein J45TS6_35770 [Paenibacillus sp. J45TS6]|nr:hypothetical protein J45TS6_35770 [Paenibacillus sp. J45TS6]
MASDSGTWRNSDTGSSSVPVYQKSQLGTESVPAPGNHDPASNTTTNHSYNENSGHALLNVVIKKKNRFNLSKIWTEKNRKNYNSQSQKSKTSNRNLK